MKKEILATVPVSIIGTPGLPPYPPVGAKEGDYTPSKCENCGCDTIIGPNSREMKATGVLIEYCMPCAIKAKPGATVENLGRL